MVRRSISVLAVLCVVIAGIAASSATASAAPPPPSRRMPAAIEGLADYVPQTSCDPVAKPGSVALGRLLVKAYGGTSYNSAYNCATDGTVSEHYEGRAVDWMASWRSATQRRQLQSFLAWLFATRGGHRFAYARRLGVMYIVYDNRIWGAWDGAWHPHSSCASHPESSWDTTCHRNHMHISLSWEGAMKRTSFWTGRVAASDYGPCRVRDLNWAAPYTRANPRRCPQYATVRAAAGASATKRALVQFSGATVHLGSSGPAVTAVQHALHVSASGYYGSTTKAAVVGFQRRHRLMPTGGMNPTTWRTMLRAVR